MNERERDPSLDTGYDLGAETPEEAAEFAETAAEFGLSAVPVEPPKQIRAALMAKIASTPQLPAVEATPTEGSAARRARARWFARPATIITAAAAAAVLVVAGTLAGIGVSEHRSGPTQSATSVSQIADAADVQRATTKIATGGSATLVWSLGLKRSAITVRGLADAPAGKTYELWYLRGKRAVPAGTMSVSAGGVTTRVLDGEMAAGDTVAVTVEPHGGTKQPTTLPILAIRS